MAILSIKKFGPDIKFIALLISIVVLSLFCVAFTINNNYDSVTYHLPKVEHWIQNGDVEFFPTINTRQDYLAPFEEYFILNLRLLSGNILFVNMVQFFSFVNCILLATLIAGLFGLSSKNQIVAAAFAATIPMAFFQATSAQTDLVVSFFMMALVYFGYSFILEDEFSKEKLLFFCLSFSLGILTKATFYIFAFPFCAAFGLYCIRLFRQKAVWILLGVSIFFLLVNAPFLNRNFRQFGSLLGPQKTDSYYLENMNEQFSLNVMLSNCVKNIGSHLALPSDYWNGKIDSAVIGWHNIIGFPLNSIVTNWDNMDYRTVFIMQYDFMSNFLHTILFLAALVVLLVNSKKISIWVRVYFVLIITAFLMFSFILKWQPWQNRLNLAIFFLSAPGLAYVAASFKRRWIGNLISVILLIISITFLFFYNPGRSIFGANSIFLKDNNSYIYDYKAVNNIADKLRKNNIDKVGFVFGDNSLEWQYWLLLKNVQMEHIYFHKDFLKAPDFKSDFQYRAIIVDNSLHKIPKLEELVPDRSNILEMTRIDNRNIILIMLKEPQQNVVTRQ